MQDTCHCVASRFTKFIFRLQISSWHRYLFVSASETDILECNLPRGHACEIIKCLFPDNTEEHKLINNDSDSTNGDDKFEYFFYFFSLRHPTMLNEKSNDFEHFRVNWADFIIISIISSNFILFYLNWCFCYVNFHNLGCFLGNLQVFKLFKDKSLINNKNCDKTDFHLIYKTATFIFHLLLPS